MEDNFDKLEKWKVELAEPNWDSYDADPMPLNIIEKTRRVLLLSTILKYIPSFMAPAGRSMIQIEYTIIKNGKEDYLEFEIYKDKINGMRMYPDHSHILYRRVSKKAMCKLIEGFHADNGENGECLM